MLVYYNVAFSHTHRNGIWQRVMLRYCMFEKNEKYNAHQNSAASIQGLSLKATLVQSTTASIYLRETIQSLKECPAILCNVSDTL